MTAGCKKLRGDRALGVRLVVFALRVERKAPVVVRLGVIRLQLCGLLVLGAGIGEFALIVKRIAPACYTPRPRRNPALALWPSGTWRRHRRICPAWKA